MPVYDKQFDDEGTTFGRALEKMRGSSSSKPGPVGSFLNRRDVQTKLGVAKKYFSNNEEVLDAFNKFTTYDTTSFVEDLLDGGIKVVVLAGNYDYVANAIGNLNWMTGLKGKDNYGEKLRAVQPKTLKYPLGGVFGTVRALKFATTGAKIAFINVNLPVVIVISTITAPAKV
ncbi:hypothetical protein FOZ60_002858 [Perkinsus olseni]|uniref:Uncharacterized protein n=1 Tax=Perkinsus olseni TaxID=32597 RepID=A0A7J6NWY1_PEROL|nr:hypothetical protein FOZ60_002858 [Perkinsus olseni]